MWFVQWAWIKIVALPSGPAVAHSTVPCNNGLQLTKAAVRGVIFCFMCASAATAGAAQPPAPVPTQAPEARRVVDLDKPGVPVYLDAEKRVSIDVRALIPTGTYRARTIVPYRGAGWMLLPGFDLAPVSSAFGEGCVSRYRALKAVFDAKGADEALQLRQDYEAGAARGECLQLESMLLRMATRLSPQLTYGIEPVAGADIRLELERIDVSSNVLQAYHWPLLPPKIDPVATETEWIVSEVTARMASLVGRRGDVTVTPTAGLPGRYRISGLAEGGAVEVDVAPGPWAPGSFAPVAKALGPKRPALSGRVYSNDMLTALTTPTIGTLLAVNLELGLALRSDPRSPASHEAAALLLATVAMRAADTGLEDIRPLVNRAVAHLALAAAASNARVGVEGEVALAAIDALTGRQIAAAARLNRSKARSGSASARAWYRALMMRATGDWRMYRAAGTPSLLEQVEHARALKRSWTQPRAADFRREQGRYPESALWGRAILGDHASVELGSELAGSRLEAEMSEAAALARYFVDPDVFHWLQAKGETDGLNPISPDLWARLAEGSVADAAWKFHEHLTGLPPSPAPADFRQQFAEQFPRSLVIQAMAHWWRASAPAPELPDRCEDLARSIRAEPFRLGARAGDMAAQACGRLGRAFPALAARITPWTPSGTLFDFKNRLEAASLMPEISQSDWSAARRMTFYEPSVLGFAIGRAEQRDPTAADYRAFRRERAYSLALLRDWRYVTSSRGDIGEALEPGRAACRLDAEECLGLVDVLRAEGHVDEAFSIAMRVFGPGQDISVGASNSVVWIVDEATQRGKLAVARDIADRAAETRSYVSLLVQARLTERMGDAAEAHRRYWLLDETDGTNQSRSLALRELARAGKGHDELARALAQLGEPFKILLSSKNEEVAGLIVDGGWLEQVGVVRRAQAERIGLQPGDAVTRVNGYDILNTEQFWAVLSLYDEPVIEVTVRSDSRPEGPVVLRGPFWHARHGLIAASK